MGCGSSTATTADNSSLALGSTPSHGNPKSTNALNSELNNVARNTDNTDLARRLVDEGASLTSTNGGPWYHTPLHQACYHGRFEMAKMLVALGAPLTGHSNPCGRGQHGTPLELARGGGHHKIAAMIEEALKGNPPAAVRAGGEAGGGKGLFLLHNADLVGRDDRATAVSCGSLGEATKLLACESAQKRGSAVAYAWREGQKKLVTISAVGAGEMGNGPKWSKGAELIVYGKDTGHRSNGKILIALQDVDCCFGDGKVTSGVRSYDAALRAVVQRNNVGQTAYFLHTPSNRLIEKPKNRGSNWCSYSNYGWLFLWADEALGGGGDYQPPSVPAKTGAGTAAAAGGGSWVCVKNVDMCCQGDVDGIGDWKREGKSVADLRRMCEERGHMAFSIDPSGKYFRHCAFKRFDFQLTPEHCTPSPGYTNEIHIFTPGARAKVAADPPPVPIAALEGELAFNFANLSNGAFDKNGVLYAIGSSWGAATYSNPADSGRVSVGWSRDAANYYSTAGGHKVGDARQAGSVICAHSHPGSNATMWSKGAPNAYFEIDLRSVTLKPTHYAYRNDYGGGGNHPRTFELQASKDGRSWVTLRKHSGESWSGKCAKAWPIDGAADYYRIFRVQNHGHPNHLCCSGLELYGLVRGAPSSSTSASTSASAEAPIVIGTAVEDVNGKTRMGAPVGVEVSAQMPLVEMAAVLKRELGVKGTNLSETIEAAVVELGLGDVAAKLNLVDKARKCMDVLGCKL